MTNVACQTFWLLTKWQTMTRGELFVTRAKKSN